MGGGSVKEGSQPGPQNGEGALVVSIAQRAAGPGPSAVVHVRVRDQEVTD